MSEYTVRIEGGSMRFVYDDAIADLLDEGTASVCRVSHVEPHPVKGGWVADMTPAVVDPRDAVIIGINGEWFPASEEAWVSVEPFKTRAEALSAERKWLTRERGL